MELALLNLRKGDWVSDNVSIILMVCVVNYPPNSVVQ